MIVIDTYIIIYRDFCQATLTNWFFGLSSIIHKTKNKKGRNSMSKVACANQRCRYCSIDVEMGRTLVCTANPQFITVPSARVFILKCNTYLKRDLGQQIKPLLPCDEFGLYPGQCRPPADYSDLDEDNVISAEPECST